MDTLYLILYIAAAICFLVAAFAVTATAAATTRVTARVNLVALGLLFWVLVPLINHIDTMN
jgi:hypothetical protein